MSGNRTCPACGAPISLDTSECRYCGEKLIVSQPKNNTSQTQNESPQSQYTQPQYQTTYVTSQYTQTTYVAPKKVKSLQDYSLFSLEESGRINSI